MSRLFLVLLLLWGAVTLACSGEDTTETDEQVSANSGNIDSGDQTGDQVVSLTLDSPGLDCSTANLLGQPLVKDLPEEAALIEACYYARHIQQIDFQLTSVVSGESGSSTSVTIVGYSETCEDFCPGEVQKTYQVNLVGQEWEAVEDHKPFWRSDETVANAEDEFQRIVDSTVLTISDTTPPLYGGLFWTLVTADQDYVGLGYRLLVDLPNGQTDMQFVSDKIIGYDGPHRYHANYNTEPLQIKAFQQVEGDVVIKAYKVTMDADGKHVEGDWIYIN